MVKKVRINKARLKRFKLEPLDELKAAVDLNPELKKRLKEDFSGTLKAEGIVIDDAFRNNVRKQWRSMIKADVRESMDRQPAAKKPLYTMVSQGKPLKVKVKIDRTTGKKSVKPKVDS